jgi:hypothetical protein
MALDEKDLAGPAAARNREAHRGADHRSDYRMGPW